MIVLVVRTTGILEILKTAPQRDDEVVGNSPPSASNRPTYHMHPQKSRIKGGVAKMMISWSPCLSLGRAIYNIQNKITKIKYTCQDDHSAGTRTTGN
jgi:hypothetical protein